MKRIKHLIHRMAGWVYFKTMSVYSLEKSNASLKEKLLSFGVIDPFEFKQHRDCLIGVHAVKNDVCVRCGKDFGLKKQVYKNGARGTIILDEAKNLVL